eukprot:GILK01011030.1.p1 GENE.GILK01011030.1~~GILK01011030.1.p1  ORF type:complete len:319 (+),score=33.42 GILK01011030.1:17-973(+)
MGTSHMSMSATALGTAFVKAMVLRALKNGHNDADEAANETHGSSVIWEELFLTEAGTFTAIWVFLAKLSCIRNGIIRWMDRSVSGSVFHAYSRSLWFMEYIQDTILRNESPSGVRNVVMLGAGLDGTAFRLAQMFPAVTFWDTDVSAVLAPKVAVRAKYFQNRHNLHLHPLDLMQDDMTDLAERIKTQSGHCVFVAEALLMYISAERVRKLFVELLPRLAPQGYTILFSWIETSDLFDQTSGIHHAAQRIHQSQSHERFRWHCTHTELRTLLLEAHIRPLLSIDALELAQQYEHCVANTCIPPRTMRGEHFLIGRYEP